MNTFKKITLLTFVILAWTVFIGFGFIEGYLLRPLTTGDSPEEFVEVCKEIISQQHVGNLSLLMLERGKVAYTFFYSADQSIDQHSAFPVASISKWVTAIGVMKLVEQGKLDLDVPVETYLTRWHLPESEYDNDQVTVRRLLSHSAGLVDDLGYAGFAVEEEVQSLESSLDKASDGYYSEGKAQVGYEPGSQFMYSGASYTLLQLLIEEVSGQTFTSYMNTQVIQPLDMDHSSYELSDSSRIGLVPVFRVDGTVRTVNRFTAKAAASLMTSVSDLSKFMIAQLNEEHLSSSMIRQMAEPTSYRGSMPYYGLGPKLFSQNHSDSKIIGHDGSGNNAINSAARLDLMSDSGIIILETGHYSIASDLADEWLFWKAGIADRVVMERNITNLLILLVAGYGFLIMFFIVILKRARSKMSS